jgi:putative pyruvate formate lyase activating enzyme
MRVPGFIALAESGELERRLERAREILRSCALCPRACEVDRTSGGSGYCRAGERPRIYRHMLHTGEEPPISGARGSGVIFFSHCTMSCCYCQNYRMSHEGRGVTRTAADLASMMSTLLEAGAHNLNLVSATHYTHAVLEALQIAARAGASLPVVWNTSGYEGAATLELLDGVVDVYLADARYSSPEAAERCSDAPDYVAVNREALRTMRRQVGPLELDEDGLAVRGLIVRHLVLPNGIAGTEDTLEFIARELSPGVAVSLMAQYYPTHRAAGMPELGRRITRAEWRDARRALEASAIAEGWVQAFPDELSPIAGTEIEPDGDDVADGTG